MDKKTKIGFNVVAIVCILIFSAVLAPITLQNDTFYTIKIGEHILESGIDMAKDPFSFHNIPYTYPHWLYDVAIYFIYSIGGMVRNIYINNSFILHIRNYNIFYKQKSC